MHRSPSRRSRLLRSAALAAVPLLVLTGCSLGDGQDEEELPEPSLSPSPVESTEPDEEPSDDQAAALERLVEDVKALDGMWVATLDEIARHAETAVPQTREVRRIAAPEGYFDGRGPVTALGAEVATA